MGKFPPKGLFSPNWPTERENIEISLAIERPRTPHQAALDVAGMRTFGYGLGGGRKDLYKEELERQANERISSWIRAHRGGR